MAAGRIDIILAAKPEALVNGLEKGQAAIKTFESIAGTTVRRNQEFFGQLGQSMALMSGVAKSAFESVNKSLELSGSTSSKETAKILGNVSAIVDGVAVGANSFNEFQTVAVTALEGISAAFPAITGGLATMAGPIGLAVGAIGALITGYFAFTAAAEENNQAINEQNKALSDAEVQAGVLFKKLKDGNLTYQEKSKLISEINEKYGSHLKYIEDEKKFVQELDRVYKQVIESIKLKFAIQANEKEIERIVQQIQANEKLINIQKKSLEYYKSFGSAAPSSSSSFNAKKEVERLQESNKLLEKEASDLLAKSSEFSKRLGIVFSDAPAKGTKGKNDIFFIPNLEQIIGVAQRQIKDFLDKIQEDLASATGKFAFFPDKAKEKALEEVKILEAALEKLGQAGVSATNQKVQELQGLLQKAKDAANDVNFAIADVNAALAANESKYSLLPDGEATKLTNEIRILEDGLQELGEAGFRQNSPLVEDWTTKLKAAKEALEDLNDAANAPEGGYRIPSNAIDQSNVSSDGDKPKPLFDINEAIKNFGTKGINAALNLTVPNKDEISKNITTLQRELAEQQDILKSDADKKQKEAARERIALIREEIAAEKERGNTFTQIAKNVYDSIRNEIKALLAKAVAYSIINALQSGPLGFFLAAPAAAGTSALFDSLIPKLDVGTNNVLTSGLAIIHAGEKVVPATVASGGYSDRRSNQPIPITGTLSAYSIKLASDVGAEKALFIS